MSAGDAFTWGSLATPLNDTMHSVGVDAHVGFDVLVSSTVLIILAYFGGRKYRKSEMTEPTGKLDFSTFFEIVVGGVYTFFRDFLHKKAQPLFFLLGSVAFFILCNNLIGSIPGFNPPTDQFNTTIVLGLVIFVTTHIMGIMVHGGSYIKQFLGPLWWLAWLIFPIEIISHLVRPLSLALRLFGNITGDHKVGAVFFGLIPLLVPLPFMGLGIFVAFVQTFVFILLSLVYLQMAMSHDH